MEIRIIFVGIIFLCFCGCNSFFSNSYTLDIVAEKKVQASRKNEIIEADRIKLTAIITYLNDVSAITYHNREYFFVEIYGEDQVDYGNMVEYLLNHKSPLWVREVTEDEFDEILKPNNKWSKCYLVAFEKIGGLREMLLEVEIARLGKMDFDFGFKALPMQF